MYCRNCGEQMNDNQAICIKCGVKTGEGTTFCSNCGQTVAANAEVCMNCGVAIKKTGNLNGQDKIVMILIAFFLGALGVHNFMMGENKKGILRLVLTLVGALTCGITMLIAEIFALIDLVKIAMGTYTVDPTKLV